MEKMGKAAYQLFHIHTFIEHPVGGWHYAGCWVHNDG